jgi:hypothetical protein
MRLPLRSIATGASRPDGWQIAAQKATAGASAHH